MQRISDFRLLIAGTDRAYASALASALAAQLPSASTDVVDPEDIRARPHALAVVIDARNNAAGARTRARTLRAMGFGGALVLAGAESEEPGDAEMGLAAMPAERVPFEITDRLATEMARAELPYADVVARARRLVAAGEIALRLQHSLNNPLAGILAETQLMLMDPQSEEQQATLERIVTLCRRMIELNRSLDGVGERPAPPGKPVAS